MGMMRRDAAATGRGRHDLAGVIVLASREAIRSETWTLILGIHDPVPGLKRPE